MKSTDTLLKTIPFLSNLPDSAFASLAKHSAVRHYPKNTTIFLQGDNATIFYLVVEGWVKLFRQTMDGQESIINLCSSGDIVSQAALFQTGPLPCSAEAIEDTALLAIPASDLRQMISQNGEIALNLLHSTAHYINNLELQIEHLSVMTAPQRVGCFLLRCCRDATTNTFTFSLPYDKSLVATYLGIQRETFSRSLKRLQDIGVETEGHGVTIHDIAALRNFTCASCSHPNDCTPEHRTSCPKHCL